MRAGITKDESRSGPRVGCGVAAPRARLARGNGNVVMAPPPARPEPCHNDTVARYQGSIIF